MNGCLEIAPPLMRHTLCIKGVNQPAREIAFTVAFKSDSSAAFGVDGIRPTGMATATAATHSPLAPKTGKATAL
jgi:hypothetical protein